MTPPDDDRMAPAQTIEELRQRFRDAGELRARTRSQAQQPQAPARAKKRARKAAPK